jgi:spore germination protein KC
MRRLASITLLLILIISSLTACWDAKEIDDWAYAYIIGVDKGVDNALRFTYYMPTMKQESGGGGTTSGSGGQSGGKKGYTTISIDAPTFYAGVDMTESSVSRRLNYMHAKYLIISEDLAREGVERFINGMVRSRQIRRIMHIIIVRGKASEFVEQFSPALTSAISKAQEGLMATNEDTGLFIDTSYHDFIKDMKTTYRMAAAPLAALNDFSNYKTSGNPPKEFKSEGDYYAGELPRSGGNKYEFFGTALFDGDKMVGELNGDETRALLMVRDEFHRASIAIADPKDKELRVTVIIKAQKKPNIKLDFREGKPVINVKIFLEGDIQNLQSPTEYESVELKPVLEEAYKVYIKGIIDKTIDKCKNLNADVFGFGEKAVMHFLTIQEWEEYNWLGEFKNAEVTTEVEFTIRRTGTLLKTSPTRNTKGEKK